MAKAIEREEQPTTEVNISSQLRQWPVQIKLVPVNAPYFNNANLLVSADCSAYAYGNFHNEFMKNKVTIIGCPKLDDVDYSEKLTEIIKNNNIKSVTAVSYTHLVWRYPLETFCTSNIIFVIFHITQNITAFIIF